MIIRNFINTNIGLSRAVDGVLPARLREDGNRHFRSHVLPHVLLPGSRVYDLGGGSRPCVDLADKQRLGLTIVGLDISAEELALAPAGVYDKTIAADLCSFVGDQEADLVVCQATLEHVPDTPGALRAIASCLKPGGIAVLFAPCRNAAFARLNLLLPQELKRKILFAIFPQKAEGHDGFRAYYDHCTPRDIERLAAANGLQVQERRLFWISSYFTAFTPLFVLWRFMQGLHYLVVREQAAETFWYVLVRPRRQGPSGGSSDGGLALQASD